IVPPLPSAKKTARRCSDAKTRLKPKVESPRKVQDQQAQWRRSLPLPVGRPASPSEGGVIRGAKISQPQAPPPRVPCDPTLQQAALNPGEFQAALRSQPQQRAHARDSPQANSPLPH